MLLSNRVAIITGSAKGMGKGIALKFSEEGCAVAVVDIDIVEAENTAAEIKRKEGKALAIKCDVSDEMQVKATVDHVVKSFGHIDILVNNAGGAHIMAPIEELLGEQWDMVMNLNIKSHFLFGKYVVPLMKANKYGKIIGTSSIGAIQPPGHVIAYNTAKSAILGFTADLATALAPCGINVNAIVPGPIQTHFYDGMTGQMNEQQKQGFFNMLGKKVPLQRSGTPEDIANAALFLASDMSSFITGQTLYVSGGLPLLPPSPPPPPK
ncbi:MAG: SDR family oxidoreductase [Dehalococcoidales bacterium]|nr:SDR family oxidoreductase [Dehalococcoidales bacterium]